MAAASFNKYSDAALSKRAWTIDHALLFNQNTKAVSSVIVLFYVFMKISLQYKEGSAYSMTNFKLSKIL